MSRDRGGETSARDVGMLPRQDCPREGTAEHHREILNRAGVPVDGGRSARGRQRADRERMGDPPTSSRTPPPEYVRSPRRTRTRKTRPAAPNAAPAADPAMHRQEIKDKARD